MKPSPLCRRPAELLDGLRTLVDERKASELEIEETFSRSKKKAKVQFERANRDLRSRYESDKRDAETEYARIRQSTADEFKLEYSTTKREYEETVLKIKTDFDTEKEKAKEALRDSHWEGTTVTEISRTAVKNTFSEIKRRTSVALHQVRMLRAETMDVLTRYRQESLAAEEVTPVDPDSFGADSLEEMQSQLAIAAEKLRSLNRLTVPKFQVGSRPIWLFLLLWFVTTVVAVIAIHWKTGRI